MPKKAYAKTGRTCRVTFSLTPDSQAQTVALCGEFNDWQPTAHLLQRRKDGNFSLTLSLTAGHQYRYRYLWMVNAGKMTLLRMTMWQIFLGLRIL